MVLNVLKGSAYALNQVDMTRSLSADETVAIERGTLLKIDANGEWRVAGANQPAPSADAGDAGRVGVNVYIALMPDTDLVAGMAGNVPQGGLPVLTGLSLIPTLEVETDMYDLSIASWAIGDKLCVGQDGRVTRLTEDGQTMIGRVTAVPVSKYINSAVAVAGWRTGASVNVLRYMTMFAPSVDLA